jgi:hypothetical protein
MARICSTMPGLTPMPLRGRVLKSSNNFSVCKSMVPCAVTVTFSD